MSRASLIGAAIGVLLALAAALTHPAPLPSALVAGASGPDWHLREGFIVHARDRFDPMIQRLMAEQSLKALPLRGGQLFYIVPVSVDPRLEEMQIRYLEMLLDHQADEPSAPGP
jgi:hypothetical protein